MLDRHPLSLIPTQAPTRRQNTMTGYLWRKWVRAHGIPHRSRARVEVCCHGGVGGPAASGYGEEDAVDAAAVGGKGWVEGYAAQIFLDFQV